MFSVPYLERLCRKENFEDDTIQNMVSPIFDLYDKRVGYDEQGA